MTPRPPDVAVRPPPLALSHWRLAAAVAHRESVVTSNTATGTRLPRERFNYAALNPERGRRPSLPAPSAAASTKAPVTRVPRSVIPPKTCSARWEKREAAGVAAQERPLAVVVESRGRAESMRSFASAPSPARTRPLLIARGFFRATATRNMEPPFRLRTRAVLFVWSSE
jgi:hypothetical protein